MSEVRGDYPKISTGHPEAGRAFANALDSSLAREAKLLADFDRVTAELASANRYKDAYAQNAIDLRKRVDALQALLTAADDRADVLEGWLRRWSTEAGGIFCALKYETDAALKPAEGRGDEQG